jgi:fructose-1,6-bisphosphatase/inositol monophosphatase family enzyme
LTEESRDNPFYSPENATYLGVGDELDGTGNNKRAKRILPSCAIFTIFNNFNPKFKDALATAVLNHSNGDLWSAVKGKGCFYNEKRVYTSKATELGRDTYLMIDEGICPKPELSFRFYDLKQKCWVRNIACAGIHLAGVASGSYNGWDGFLSFVQKPEELAAGYLLISEAGGVIYNSDGFDIGNERFNWNRTYEIIAAATKQLEGEIRKNLISEEKAKDLAGLVKHL